MFTEEAKILINNLYIGGFDRILFAGKILSHDNSIDLTLAFMICCTSKWLLRHKKLLRDAIKSNIDSINMFINSHESEINTKQYNKILKMGKLICPYK